ncbi:MAG TPA: 3-oxoacyl-ACP reductase family protein [Blastocatellia bacterium]|nr:3-oxoacyl-ACP reductase family protein [Blastocatellia bacterium]
MKLKNRIALVTGGGSGIGREICLVFAREGASVAVNDINAAGIEETIRLMGESGGRALAVPADVSDSDQVRRMFAAAHDRYGTLDILVNNAGIAEVRGPEETDRLNRIFEAQMGEMMSGGPIRTRWEMTQSMDDETWDRMLRVHLYGTFYCTREALKLMEPKSYGRIINISSIAATEGLDAAPHYSAAKAGILGFTRALAREVGPFGITVNAIAPGYIETPMTAPLSEAVRGAWIMNTPTKKSGKPKDIAVAALYLADEENDFMTGQVISPCGGWWMP